MDYHPLYRSPFNNRGLWTAIFLLVVSVLRFCHLLRGTRGVILALASQIAALLIVVFLIHPTSRSEIGFNRFKLSWLFIAIGGGLAAGAAIALINRFVFPAWDWIVVMDRTLLPEAWRGLNFGLTEVGLAVIGGVLTPVAEEFFFRGLVIAAWRGRLGLWATLFAQALIFGFLHLAHVGVEISPQFAVHPGLAVNIFLSTTLGGFLFGLIRVKSGSVWPAVIAHAAVNLAAAVL